MEVTARDARGLAPCRMAGLFRVALLRRMIYSKIFSLT
jgi:hypothetical protein